MMMFIGRLLGLCPPPKSSEYMQAESCFTKEELAAVKHQFCMHALNQYSQAMDDAHLLEWCGLASCPAYLQRSLCHCVRMQQQSDEEAITLDDVIIAKAKCEKMDRETNEDFAFDLLAGGSGSSHQQPSSASGPIPRQQLELAIAAVVQVALEKAGCTTPLVPESAAAIASGALECGQQQDALSREGFHKWCRTVPAIKQALLSLLAPIGAPTQRDIGQAAPQEQQALLSAGAAGQSIPRALGQLPELAWGACSPADGLLRPEWQWLLSQGLAPDCRQEWRLLFNSSKHGMSFSTFMGRVGEAAPTLLIIRDKGGYLFGGMAFQPWRKTGTFYGDHSNCIFSLLPQALLYPASGINTNLQWCGQGFSQLPNGVGFGGQVGNFGVWLDSSFDHGMSRPVATYGSPSLSSSQVFQVDAVECWLLKPPEEEDRPAAGAKGGNGKGSSSNLAAAGGKAGGGNGSSVLGQAKEDQKILEWAGVAKGYSAGIRDEPIED